MKHLKFSILFLLVAAMQLTGQLLHIVKLSTFSKPLITLSLAIFLITATSIKGRFHKRMLAGLIFALLGDMIPYFFGIRESFFVYQLAAFLGCSLCYISAFYLDFKSAPELDKKGAKLTIISCGILSTAYFFYLRPHLGLMRVPVLAYILVISLMFMMAAFRNLRVNSTSFYLIIIGAGCFVISDALLAYNEFVVNLPYSQSFVILTYMVAQLLITLGAVERQLIHKA
jgi:uncharacterized membrane protein YhhN